ncbi:MAG: hypothetical protein GY868_05135 [Deltaproteobacteria bacterium]|nr:hypothetical protein [Deltaproteobacteria bacterium]
MITDENGKNYWSMATVADAKTVGDTVSSDACKRCHVNTGGKVFSPYGTLVKAFKYGTDFVAEPYEYTYDTGDGIMATATIAADVHAAAGKTCGGCHFIGDHKVRYGNHNVSWAHDIEDDDFDCGSCHAAAPHKNTDNQLSEQLDGHIDFLACQTCHIRSTGGLVRRDLRNPIEVYGDGHFYEFKDTVAYGVEPEFRWFDGTSGGWEGVFEGPCPIGPRGSKKDYRQGGDSKITAFKRYEALLWFDLFVGQPVPYILKDFFVDGDLVSAANKGMDASGWFDKGAYDFEARRAMGMVIPFPMICALKLDHGVQSGENALGYDLASCNSCHSKETDFWKFLGYSKRELRALQKVRAQ